MVIASTALASPLMDFSQGKGSIDLTWRNTENSASGDSFEKKYNLDGAITFGLGNKWAFQYRNFEPKSDNTRIEDDDLTLKLATNEFNLLYKLDKNVAAFAGYVTMKGTMTLVGGESDSSDTKKMWQGGVMATAPLGEKLNLWGMVGAGNNLTNWEAGMGYAFSPNAELNVNYRMIKVDELSGANVKAKGLGFGLTFKW